MSFWSRHEKWLFPLLLYAVTFAIRLIFLNQMSDSPLFDHPIMDERYHVELARQINSPESHPDEPFYRAPLYPYLLAMFFKITSGSFFWSKFIQIVVGSFVPLLVFAFGLRLFTRKVAYVAAIVTAFYPTLIYYDNALLITSTMVLLTTLLAWQLYRCQQLPHWLNFLAAGALLGLAGLARPNILLLGPALFLWVWLVLRPKLGWRPALLRYVLIAAGASVVVLPTTIRNYQASGDIILIAWQGGYNFFLGNHRQANGWSATAPGIDKTWEGGYREAIAIAEQRTGRDLSKAEVSDVWYDMAWEEITADPGHFLALQIKKLRLFFNGFEIPNNQNIYMAREEAPVVAPLMFAGFIYFPYGLVAPLALIGIALSVREWRKYLLLYLLLATYIISLLLFFVCARYRQPLLPFLILFASVAVIRAVDWIRARNYKTVAAVGAILVLLLIESNHNMIRFRPETLTAENHFVRGNAFLEENRVSRAKQEFKRAVKADSTFARGYHNLGIVLVRQGQPRRAIQQFMKAIQYEPQVAGPYLSLATTFLDLGERQQAIEVLERARQVQPNNYLVHFKLGMTYYETGQLDNALSACRKALELNPSDPAVREVLRQLRAAQESQDVP